MGKELHNLYNLSLITSWNYANLAKHKITVWKIVKKSEANEKIQKVIMDQWPCCINKILLDVHVIEEQ